MRDEEFAFNPVRLIEEVKKRPGLYDQGLHPLDREDKLTLWKEVGAALCSQWDTYDRAAAYDRVLQLQRKWRSLRDAYNRELRSRKTGVRVHRRVYVYFKKLKFLGGFEGEISSDSDHSNCATNEDQPEEDSIKTELVEPTRKKRKKRRVKKPSSEFAPEEVEMPIFPVDVPDESDSDKLFLLSFLPEMKQFPLDIKMWARAQIANVMQEAVTAHMSKVLPSSANERRFQIKQPRDSFD
ncbi:unnamed protein product [Pieris macdunnoughi]|uniref:MADF domain-containing protein n=1 Tax=Pieris macdunnoughi TaxID=345717 RepID=A0A821PHM0_9NEOP|nr:unnamed protein product [Pieris macdunnoughi]